jgi:adenine-specific DNA-methyltransferase
MTLTLASNVTATLARLPSQDQKIVKAPWKREVNEANRARLFLDVSRPFARPRSGQIAVKVINHFGDEVMKAFGV